LQRRSQYPPFDARGLQGDFPWTEDGPCLAGR
jgi:hypothetical protein